MTIIAKVGSVLAVAGIVAATPACNRKETVAVTLSTTRAPSAETAGGLAPADEALLAIAREALRQAVEEGKRYEPPVPEDPALREPRGVFVTLKEGGELRGCIGYILPREPLYIAVRDNAVNAALNDPRFLPVTARELHALEIEISVMTLLQPATPEEIVVGQDGLYIEARGRAGILLPQVAPEQGWDRVRFLEGVCMKAGLPADAYRWKDAKLQKFQARIFGGPYAAPAR